MKLHCSQCKKNLVVGDSCEITFEDDRIHLFCSKGCKDKWEELEKMEHLESRLKDIDSSLEKEDSSILQQISNPSVLNVTSIQPKAMYENDIGKSPAFLKKDFIEFLRKESKESRLHEIEKGKVGGQNADFAREGEKAIEAKKNNSQESRQETPDKEAESPDPTEVIDWLLNGHSASK